jgi:hypothetical protein
MLCSISVYPGHHGHKGKRSKRTRLRQFAKTSAIVGERRSGMRGHEIDAHDHNVVVALGGPTEYLTFEMGNRTLQQWSPPGSR